MRAPVSVLELWPETTTTDTCIPQNEAAALPIPP